MKPLGKAGIGNSVSVRSSAHCRYNVGNVSIGLDEASCPEAGGPRPG